MQKIDKSADKILSTKYLAWLNNKEVQHEKGNRYYCDDVAMNLYKCQSGVCAYTEMHICIPELFADSNWENGRYKIPNDAAYARIDHLGELDHFDPLDKKINYWNWDNLFMIHSKINSIKSDTKVVSYLKPDLATYSPEQYFDYDEDTHRFIPNTDIDDPNKASEIQYMIDNVLFLNHGVVKNDRRDYINVLIGKRSRGEDLNIYRFFTAVKSVLG